MATLCPWKKSRTVEAFPAGTAEITADLAQKNDGQFFFKSLSAIGGLYIYINVYMTLWDKFDPAGVVGSKKSVLNANRCLAIMEPGLSYEAGHHKFPWSTSSAGYMLRIPDVFTPCSHCIFAYHVPRSWVNHSFRSEWSCHLHLFHRTILSLRNSSDAISMKFTNFLTSSKKRVSASLPKNELPHL